MRIPRLLREDLLPPVLDNDRLDLHPAGHIERNAVATHWIRTRFVSSAWPSRPGREVQQLLRRTWLTNCDHTVELSSC